MGRCGVFWRCAVHQSILENGAGEEETKSGQGGAACNEETLTMKHNMERVADQGKGAVYPRDACQVGSGNGCKRQSQTENVRGTGHWSKWGFRDHQPPEGVGGTLRKSYFPHNGSGHFNLKY